MNRSNWRVRLGFVLPVLAGLLLWQVHTGDWLEGASYDWLFRFKPAGVPAKGTNVVIVYMDQTSYDELRQDPAAQWNRTLHAQLLDRLTTDRARLVVLDLVFSGEGEAPAGDQALAEAIKRNGHVVLAADFSEQDEPGATKKGLQLPLPLFRMVTTSVGMAELVGRREAVARQCWHSPGYDYPGLPWAAAAAVGVKPSRPASGSYWLNYYGPRGTIPRKSYCDALKAAPGLFQDKVVYVGADVLGTDYPKPSSDVRRTPYSQWGEQSFPGVEIMATGYLNLVCHDALIRVPGQAQALVFIVFGAVLGWGAVRWKVIQAVGLTAGVALIVFAAALALHWKWNLWFSWMVVVGVQAPVALAWSVGAWLRKSQPEPEFSSFPRHHGKGLIPNVPDHTLLQRIGSGGYGEVWLAQNTIGMFRAVKFLFRERYPKPDPYQREFRGIEKYMPISLNHPGLVHVLHLGRNDRAGYFFYLMEAADDQVTGQQINPEQYAARNLSGELSKRNRLPVEECVGLGLQLTTALGFLHANRLIHRDIKPSNIIFVGGIPKLADVGLVAEIASEGRKLSYIGTEGYIPPEGPGTAPGDIYSLGKVIYEASMGRDRLQYPDLPTSVVEGTSDPNLLLLNDIILKACESDPKRRYQSAASFHADLLRLQERLLDLRSK